MNFSFLRTKSLYCFTHTFRDASTSLRCAQHDNVPQEHSSEAPPPYYISPQKSRRKRALGEGERSASERKAANGSGRDEEFTP